jgi:hypothetical protein
MNKRINHQSHYEHHHHRHNKNESKYTEGIINDVVDNSYLDGKTLMNWIDENYNIFHTGKDVGSMTPTLRVPTKGQSQ